MDIPLRWLANSCVIRKSQMLIPNYPSYSEIRLRQRKSQTSVESSFWCCCRQRYGKRDNRDGKGYCWRVLKQQAGWAWQSCPGKRKEKSWTLSARRAWCSAFRLESTAEQERTVWPVKVELWWRAE